MKRKNLATVLSRYKTGWVSLSLDYQRVLASGKTLQEVARQLSKKGNPDGVLMRAAKDYSHYVGYHADASAC